MLVPEVRVNMKMKFSLFAKFGVLAGALLLLALPASAQYTQRYGAETRGDIVLTGNVLVRANNTAAIQNNDQASSKVDIDNDGTGAGTTDNSSSAILRLPTGAQVLSARLYWESRTSALASTTQNIRISTNGTAGGYVAKTDAAARVLDTGGNGRIYAATVDVTEEIQAVAAFPTQILVGGATVDIINDSVSSYAGWGLVVVYRKSGDPIRQLRVFDGFSSISGTQSFTSSLAGFRTPDAGSFSIKLGVLAFEGDRGIENDRLEIAPNSGVYTALSDAINPANNFFNSTIGQDGVSFGPTDLNPPLRNPGGATGGFSNNNNALGVDVDRFSFDASQPFFGNNQTSANLRFSTSGDTYQVTTFTTSIPTAEIVGRVFEDANFGGGAGRSLATSAGAPVPNARVELYNASNQFVRAATTDSNGFYSFSNLGTAELFSLYSVRVVNGSVASTRPSSSTGLVPVQTYRTEATSTINPASNSAIAQPITNRVGGENPAIADAAPVTTVGAALPAGAQSVTTVQLGTEPVLNVDFGFNFDLIVNTNDAGQGSLRQFILNSNALSNDGLNQAPNALFDPAVGVETSIFQIPSAALTNNVAQITLASGLVITGANAGATSIDGRTQTANVGDNNSGSFGTGGTVGVGAIDLPLVPKPEIEINGPNSIAIGLDIAAGGAIVRNVSMWGFGATGDNNDSATIRVNSPASAPNFTQLVLGASAVGSGAPVSPANYGKGDLMRIIGVAGGSVTNSLLGFGGGKGVTLNTGANNWTFQSNEFRNNSRDSGAWDGIDAQVAGTQILENLSYNNGGVGIDTYNSTGGSVIRNNTSRNNGLLCTPTTGESAGIRVWGAGNSVTLNIASNNYGAGVQIQSGGTSLISQNSIFGNGDVASNATPTPSRQIGIDLLNATNDENHGTSPFVSPNDSGDGDSGANGLLNFPIFTGQTVSGGNLTLEGFAPANSTIEVFRAAPDASGFGEGQTFAFSFVENSGADTDNTTGNYDAASLQAIGYPAGVAALVGSETGARRFRVTVAANGIGAATTLTATATVAGQTSEFSAVTVAFVTNTVNGTVYLDANRNGTLDNQESGANLNNLFVKAVLQNQNNAAQAVPVNAATGAYSFTNLAPGTYTLVLDDNNALTDIAPALPAGYVGTQSPNGTRTVTVSNQTILSQNFGLFNGAQISGQVFEDNGAGTGPGIAGVKINLVRADNGTVIDSTQTNGSGNFAFSLPDSLASTPLRVVEINPSGYNSVSGDAGTTGGTYTLATDTIQFNYVAGSAYSGLKFGDGRGVSFTGEDSQIGPVGSSVVYSHVFTAQTTGSVSFNTTQLPSPANPDWSVVTYRDSNANGVLDGADAMINGALPVVAGVPITVFLKNFIPTTAANGAQDRLTITATFTPTNGPVQTLSRSDLTTVAANTGLLLTKTVDKATAQSNDVLLYTITYRNAGAQPLTDLVVKDATPAYTTFVSAANGTLAPGLNAPTIAAPSAGNKGAVSWTFGGSLNPGQSGTVVFSVRVQ